MNRRKICHKPIKSNKMWSLQITYNVRSNKLSFLSSKVPWREKLNYSTLKSFYDKFNFLKFDNSYFICIPKQSSTLMTSFFEWFNLICFWYTEIFLFALCQKIQLDVLEIRGNGILNQLVFQKMCFIRFVTNLDGFNEEMTKIQSNYGSQQLEIS